MKPIVINLVAFFAGGLTAAGISTVTHNFERGQIELAQQQQLLEQVVEAGPGDLMADGIPQEPPPVFLPGDARPAPGAPAEPGSARPVIQIKPGASVIRVSRTNRLVEPTKDPIWLVQLVVDGKVIDQMESLTGRVDRQTLNRHIAGTKAPLPTGRYRIDRAGIEMGPFSDPELGRGYWVPISPLFSTGRSALGFHQDPSWGKRNGESGTSGCIGLQSPEATKKLVEWVQRFNVREVEVMS